MSNGIDTGRDRLSEFAIGATDSICRKIRAEDVRAFADLSGDHNALHVDTEFAARTEFERPLSRYTSAICSKREARSKPLTRRPV